MLLLLLKTVVGGLSVWFPTVVDGGVDMLLKLFSSVVGGGTAKLPGSAIPGGGGGCLGTEEV